MRARTVAPLARHGRLPMARLVVLPLAALTAALAPASAAPKLTRLGTDPAGDGPPALDVTYLDVGGHSGTLEIRIGVDGMLPVLGGYPELPGIEWIFDVGGRTFLAEAAIVSGEGTYFLFELNKDGTFQQLDSPEGTYDSADGFISIHVPYSDIGARKGMKISGTGPKGTEDVDAHVHLWDRATDPQPWIDPETMAGIDSRRRGCLPQLGHFCSASSVVTFSSEPIGARCATFLNLSDGGPPTLRVGESSVASSGCFSSSSFSSSKSRSYSASETSGSSRTW